MFIVGVVEPQQPSDIEYSIESTSTGLCINCTFLDNSTDDCVAVVHRNISQLNSSGLMNIKLSCKFNRFGDTASGCIKGVNLEQYQVGVYGVRQLQTFSGMLNILLHLLCIYHQHSLNIACQVWCLSSVQLTHV